MFVLLLNLIGILWSSQTAAIMDVAVAPNIMFITFLLNPIVYGLYFKQVREPMMKKLRSVCCNSKFNTAVVAPMPQRTD